MASLDNIWDAPVTSNSPRTSRHLDPDDEDAGVQRPAKRQKQALFFSDSEDEDGDGRVGRGVVGVPQPMVNPDIDDEVEAMFADAEKDEGLSFKEIGDLDVAAMEREAEERHRRPPPLTPHPGMPNNTSGKPSEDSQSVKDKNKGKDESKRSRPTPLNETLLLGPTGFPDLISHVKGFKVKGKGREVEDLTRLMRIYNFWSHKLHPKLRFRDTVVRIEKLCHTKRMQVALSVWRDEAHGKIHELDADLSLDSDVNEEGSNANTGGIGVSRPPMDTTAENLLTPRSLTSGQNIDPSSLSLPSSRASSQPPTSDFPDDDDLFGPPASSHPTLSPTSNSMIAKKRIVVDSDDDEEEDLWKELGKSSTQPTRTYQQHLAPGQSLDDVEDAEMWAAFGEGRSLSSATLGQPVSGSSHANSSKAGEMDIDDDEMWEIIRENEKTAQAPRPSVSDPKTLGAESTAETINHLSTGKQSMADSEMDWHDMYAN